MTSASRMPQRAGTAGGQRVALARRSPPLYSATLNPHSSIGVPTAPHSAATSHR
jgi:hypothetical protein